MYLCISTGDLWQKQSAHIPFREGGGSNISLFQFVMYLYISTGDLWQRQSTHIPFRGSNNTSLCLSLPYWLVFPSLTLERIGNLSNEDGKKLIGLDWQNITHFCTFLSRRCTPTSRNVFFSRLAEGVTTREQFSDM